MHTTFTYMIAAVAFVTIVCHVTTYTNSSMSTLIASLAVVALAGESHVQAGDATIVGGVTRVAQSEVMPSGKRMRMHELYDTPIE